MSGLNSGSTEHVETRMTPLHEHINQVFSDLAFGKEHLEDLVPEDLLQMFQFEQRRYSEHAVSTKTAVGAEHMKMRMPSKEIAKRMYCHNGPRNGPLFQYGFPEKFFQSFPAATAEIGEQLSVIEEIAAKDFGYAENKVPVRNCLEKR
jgi:hypothetical protein